LGNAKKVVKEFEGRINAEARRKAGYGGGKRL